MFAAGNIGMRKFVHQDDLWLSRQNRVDVHLFEHCPLVFDLLSRDGFHLRKELFDALAPVRLHDAHAHVFATAAAPQRFAQHAEGLANAGRIAQEQLEGSSRFLRRGSHFQPFFGLLGQDDLLRSKWSACARICGCRDSSWAGSWVSACLSRQSPELRFFIGIFGTLTRPPWPFRFSWQFYHFQLCTQCPFHLSLPSRRSTPAAI